MFLHLKNTPKIVLLVFSHTQSQLIAFFCMFKISLATLKRIEYNKCVLGVDLTQI